MTTMENVEYLESAISNCADRIETKIDALHEKIENNKKHTPAGDEKLYTAFDVIRMVQAAVSDEICGLSAGEMAIAYEVERAVVEKLAKEENA